MKVYVKRLRLKKEVKEYLFNIMVVASLFGLFLGLMFAYSNRVEKITNGEMTIQERPQ